jgi:hypothetical protein
MGNIKMWGGPKVPWDPYAYFHDNAIWSWQFAWLPHRCELSNKFIWLSYAYRGVATMNDYPEPVQVRWRNTDEHLLYLIKQ